MNFTSPATSLALLVDGPRDPIAEAVLSQASAAWIALAGLLLAMLALRPGDERPLRLVLAPLLLGDLVHVGAVVWLVETHGSWTGGAIALASSPVALFAYRAVIAWRPELLLGQTREDLGRRPRT